MSFSFSTKADLLFGSGVSAQIGEEAKKYGNRALIVTGGHSTKKSGLLAKVQAQLDEQGIKWVLYDQAKPNPLISIAEAGAEVAKEEGCSVAIALGGGSVIDLAKGICARACNDILIKDMIYKNIPVVKSIPLIAVPTTCGTGSEVNGIGVMTNDENKDKKAIKGPAVVPKRAIVDPKLMMTMPKSVFASVAFDALCHLDEAYLSTGATPISDMFALEGLKLMSENLLKVYNNYDDEEAWSNVALASTYGGYTLDMVSVVAPHGMDHPIGGLKNAVHGQGLAAISPVIFKELIPYAPERLGVISRIFGGKDENDCYKVILDLLKKIDLGITLADLGFDEDDIQWMSDNCFQVSTFTIGRTPGNWDRDLVEKMYRASMTFNKEN